MQQLRHSLAVPVSHQHDRSIVVYCPAKHNTLVLALNSLFPAAHIRYHPLSDIMKAIDVSSELHSVWLDLPSRGLGDVQQLLMALTSLVGLCRARNVPFVLLSSKSESINGMKLSRVPAWSNILKSSNIKFTCLCGCNVPWRQQHLHLKKFLWSPNVDFLIPHNKCPIKHDARILQDQWLSFYKAMLTLLFCSKYRPRNEQAASFGDGSVPLEPDDDLIIAHEAVLLGPDGIKPRSCYLQHCSAQYLPDSPSRRKNTGLVLLAQGGMENPSRTDQTQPVLRDPHSEQ